MECDAFMRRIFCAMHKGIALLLHVNAKTPISNKVFVFFEKFLSFFRCCAIPLQLVGLRDNFQNCSIAYESIFSQTPHDNFPHLIHAQVAHTFVAFAIQFIAAQAGQSLFDNAFVHVSERSLFIRMRWSENANRWCSDRCGNVHWAGVITYD